VNVSRADIEKLQTFARNSYDRLAILLETESIRDPGYVNPFLIIANRLQDMLDLDGKQNEIDLKKNHWSEFNRKPKFGESTVSSLNGENHD
jgi:hypothetical protein